MNCHVLLTAIVAALVSCKAAYADLIAAYDFDTGAGVNPEFTDRSGNGNHLGFFQELSTGSNPVWGANAGFAGGAYTFDGGSRPVIHAAPCRFCPLHVERLSGTVETLVHLFVGNIDRLRAGERLWFLAKLRRLPDVPFTESDDMSEVTVLLRSIEDGDSGAKVRLFEHVYQQLKAMAGRRIAEERSDHTLQPTALVHEVYLRLFKKSRVDAETQPRGWSGSRHFYGAAANAMRQVLIDAARLKQRKKRGGNFERVMLNPDQLSAPEMADDLLALDESMSRFEKVEPIMAELVRLRFFAGLTIREAAEQLGISPRTADDHWAYAKVWLLADMQDHSESD